MLGCTIDIMLLGVILHLMNDEEFDLIRILVVAIGASVLTMVVTIPLGLVLPALFAMIVAVVVSAIAVGVMVSLMFGVEMKRSFLIGLIYVIASTAIKLCFDLIMRFTLGTAG